MPIAVLSNLNVSNASASAALASVASGSSSAPDVGGKRDAPPGPTSTAKKGKADRTKGSWSLLLATTLSSCSVGGTVNYSLRASVYSSSGAECVQHTLNMTCSTLPTPTDSFLGSTTTACNYQVSGPKGNGASTVGSEEAKDRGKDADFVRSLYSQHSMAWVVGGRQASQVDVAWCSLMLGVRLGQLLLASGADRLLKEIREKVASGAVKVVDVQQPPTSASMNNANA